MIIIPIKWLFHWGYTLFSDIPISCRLLRKWRARNITTCISLPQKTSGARELLRDWSRKSLFQRLDHATKRDNCNCKISQSFPIIYWAVCSSSLILTTHNNTIAGWLGWSAFSTAFPGRSGQGMAGGPISMNSAPGLREDGEPPREVWVQLADLANTSLLKAYYLL